ncbi:RusA family crossover junction endodeoxyribonuclease [Ornithinibacillus sp. 4-3]|uniref:RusA family crossover junction endodeoxyribonuclease n=1 Tax=Ornithinibacillus sp. 4-3 TaxID=3231488 RepID=A0AB39HHV7_9BACI
MTEFFMPMMPPTTTHQQKKVTVRNGKPAFYEPEDLKAARAKLTAHLAKHVPDKPIDGSLRLFVKWLFKRSGKHLNGSYKTTKPDLDNSNKLLQDCMTDLGFWKDDSLIVSLITEKFWADTPGIYIKIEEV